MSRPAIPKSTSKALAAGAKPADILERLKILNVEGRLKDEKGNGRLSVYEEEGITALAVEPEVNVAGSNRKFVGIKETGKKKKEYVYHDGTEWTIVAAADVCKIIKDALIAAANEALKEVAAVEEETVKEVAAAGAEAAEETEVAAGAEVAGAKLLDRIKVAAGGGAFVDENNRQSRKITIAVHALPRALKKLVKDEEGPVGNNFHIDFADEAEAQKCQKILAALRYDKKEIINKNPKISKQYIDIEEEEVFGDPKKVSRPEGEKKEVYRLSFSSKSDRIPTKDFLQQLIHADGLDKNFKRLEEVMSAGNPRRTEGALRDEFHIAALSDARVVTTLKGRVEGRIDYFQVKFSDEAKAKEFHDAMAALRKPNGDKLIPDVDVPNPERKWGQFWKRKTKKSGVEIAEVPSGAADEPAKYIVKFKPEKEGKGFADELDDTLQARELRRKQFKRDIEGTGGRDDYTKAVLSGNFLTLGIPVVPACMAAVGGVLRVIHKGMDAVGFPGSASIVGPVSRMFLDAAESGFRHGNLLSAFGSYGLANACERSSKTCAEIDKETLKYAYHPLHKDRVKFSDSPLGFCRDFLRSAESAVIAPAVALVGTVAALPMHVVSTVSHLVGDTCTKGCRAMWEWTKDKGAEGGAPMAVGAACIAAVPTLVAGVVGYAARGLGIISRSCADLFSSTAKNIDSKNRGLLGLAGFIGQAARFMDDKMGNDLRLYTATPVAKVRERREGSLVIQQNDEGGIEMLETAQSSFQKNRVASFEGLEKVLRSCALDVKNPKFNERSGFNDDRRIYMSLGDIEMRNGSFYKMLVARDGTVSIKDTSLGAYNNHGVGKFPEALLNDQDAKRDFYSKALVALQSKVSAQSSESGISMREFKEQYGSEADAVKNLKELFAKKGVKELSPGCYEVRADDRFFETKKAYEVKFVQGTDDSEQIFLEKKGKGRGEPARVQFSKDEKGNVGVSMKLFQLVRRLSKMKDKDAQVEQGHDEGSDEDVQTPVPQQPKTPPLRRRAGAAAEAETDIPSPSVRASEWGRADVGTRGREW